MKKSVYSLLILVLIQSISYSQCNVIASADHDTICLGDCIQLSSSGNCNSYLMYDDFNSGSIGSNWSSCNFYSMFNNPYSSSADGSVYCWVGQGGGVRLLLSNSIYIGSSNCQICFDMVYAVEGDPAPCEGPEQATEGVHLFYTTTGMATWYYINYWPPDDTTCNGAGGYDSCMTQWNHYCESIPSYLVGDNVQFGWEQYSDTLGPVNSWGIDNVEIFCPDTEMYTWNNGSFDFYFDSIPGLVCPTDTGMWIYTVTLTDGTNTASDTVSVVVKNCLDIDEHLSSESFNLYPNPVNNKLLINSLYKMRMDILDPEGKVLKTVYLSKGNNEVSVSDLKNGVYFMRFIDKSGIRMEKIIVY